MESRPNAFLTTGLKVMISGIAFDHPDRLSCLRAFQFDRLKNLHDCPDRPDLNSRSSGSFAIV